MVENYADFPEHTHEDEKAHIAITPQFSVVVRYYAALRRVSLFRTLAPAMGWPLEKVEEIIAHLEEPDSFERCIAVSAYLCIPSRLRDAALLLPAPLDFRTLVKTNKPIYELFI